MKMNINNYDNKNASWVGIHLDTNKTNFIKKGIYMQENYR